MSESFLGGRVFLEAGDCRDVLAELPSNMFHACVTDPPYHLTSVVQRFGGANAAPVKTYKTGAYGGGFKEANGGTGAAFARMSRGFMGKTWDGGDVAFRPETWAHVLRVLRPGAHLLAFSGTRNYHRMVCAIEGAGFQIRDCVVWAHSQGFPKSLAVSKGIDANDIAAQWSGWGTSLKPACELVLWAQKDLRNTKEYCNLISWLDQAIVDLCARMVMPSSGTKASIVLSIASLWSGCLAAVSSNMSTSTIETASATITGLKTLKFSILPITADYITEAVCRRHGSSSNVLSATNDLNDSKSYNEHIPKPSVPENAFYLMERKQESTSARNAEECSTKTMCVENIGPSSVLLRALGRRLDGNRASVHQSAALIAIEALKSFLAALEISGIAVEPAWRRPTAKDDHFPAVELVCLARKPLSESTISANVLRWGCGAINVDGCRIQGEPWKSHEATGLASVKFFTNGDAPVIQKNPHDLGRWPANIIHDGSDEVVAAFPESSSTPFAENDPGTRLHNGGIGKRSAGGFTDSGSAARFFKTCNGRDGEASAERRYGGYGGDIPPGRRREGVEASRLFYTSKADFEDRAGSSHPTIKPLDLIQYLCRLICPPGGTVLDPFAGTGTTGEAAWREGFEALLIEREVSYCDDIRRRMALALAGPDERVRESIKARGRVQSPGPLFDGLLEAAE